MTLSSFTSRTAASSRTDCASASGSSGRRSASTSGPGARKPPDIDRKAGASREAGHLLARGENPLRHLRTGGLRVQPDKRLSPRCAHQKPGSVLQEVLVAVDRLYLYDRLARDPLRVLPGKSGEDLGPALRGEPNVDAVVIGGARLLLQATHDLGHRDVVGKQHLEKVEAGEHTISFRNVSPKRVSTALFSADDRVTLLELGADVLESDRGLNNLDAV